MSEFVWALATLVLAGSGFIYGRHTCRCRREKRMIEAIFRKQPPAPSHWQEQGIGAVGPAQWQYKPTLDRYKVEEERIRRVL